VAPFTSNTGGVASYSDREHAEAGYSDTGHREMDNDDRGGVEGGARLERKQDEIVAHTGAGYGDASQRGEENSLAGTRGQTRHCWYCIRRQSEKDTGHAL